jgi:hypothetical protein
MAKKPDPLDPALKSILDSIRQSVGGETPAAGPDADVRAAPPPVPAPPAPASAASAAGGRSVEAFLADLIRPQVSAWLDAHLPEIVQKLAAEEIQRLTRKD